VRVVAQVYRVVAQVYRVVYRVVAQVYRVVAQVYRVVYRVVAQQVLQELKLWHYQSFLPDLADSFEGTQ